MESVAPVTERITMEIGVDITKRIKNKINMKAIMALPLHAEKVL